MCRNTIPAALLLAVLAPLALSQEQRADETITVQRVIIDAHILNGSGEPLEDVRPSQLEAFIDDLPARVEAIEWVADDEDEPEPPKRSFGDPAPRLSALDRAPRGRRIVLFFQTDFQRARIRGHIRMASHAKAFIRTLQPDDQIAVVSFDSKLKLWQDFTSNVDDLDRAIDRTKEIAEVEWRDLGVYPSLAASLDPADAADAATVEMGLRRIGEALQDIDGRKTLVMFGYGIGVYAGNGVVSFPGYAEARLALETARTSVFALDVSDADWHTLEGGLEMIAEDTGGFYVKTHEFAGRAVKKLHRAIAGHYEIVLIKPVEHHGIHAVRVNAKIRGAEVFTKKTFTD
ncbi:MAG: hypothetical protein HYU52_12675 [Acidobacteria bacterium]|nr:hypothetical protein [Acidobacteriota bacterium]